MKRKDDLDREGGSSDEVRLARLMTLSYEPMLAWRLDGPIEFWNAGAERLYRGYERDFLWALTGNDAANNVSKSSSR